MKRSELPNTTTIKRRGVTGGRRTLLDHFRRSRCARTPDSRPLAGTAGLDPVDVVAAEQFVRVSQEIAHPTGTAAQFNLSFLLRNVKAETGVVHRVSRQARNVRRGRERLFIRIDAARVEKTRPLHPEMLCERVHLKDKIVDRRAARRLSAWRNKRLQGVADVIRESVGGNVVGLHKRRIEQIAQRDGIARLKTNVVLARSGKGALRE